MGMSSSSHPDYLDHLQKWTISSDRRPLCNGPAYYGGQNHLQNEMSCWVVPSSRPIQKILILNQEVEVGGEGDDELMMQHRFGDKRPAHPDD